MGRVPQRGTTSGSRVCGAWARRTGAEVKKASQLEGRRREKGRFPLVGYHISVVRWGLWDVLSRTEDFSVEVIK